jgi:glycosyltransferase involved in cell wall biosynthesis
MKNSLKISIITAVYNGEKYIEETIKSVINQTYKNIEYIIIDGNSNDNTVNIIKKYENYIFCWKSEPDKSMYDAINKGLDLSTGDYILNLNSDDCLFNEFVIENMVSEMGACCDVYYGNLIKRTGDKYQYVKLFQVTYKDLLYSRHCAFVHHSSVFVSKKIMEKVPYYNTVYKYGSDYDFILKIIEIADKIQYIDLFVSVFRFHNNSITASGKLEIDRKNILKEHGYYSENISVRVFMYYFLWFKYKWINKFRTSF